MLRSGDRTLGRQSGAPAAQRSAAVQCSSVQFSAVQCSAAQRSAVQRSAARARAAAHGRHKGQRRGTATAQCGLDALQRVLDLDSIGGQLGVHGLDCADHARKRHRSSAEHTQLRAVAKPVDKLHSMSRVRDLAPQPHDPADGAGTAAETSCPVGLSRALPSETCLSRCCSDDSGATCRLTVFSVRENGEVRKPNFYTKQRHKGSNRDCRHVECCPPEQLRCGLAGG